MRVVTDRPPAGAVTSTAPARSATRAAGGDLPGWALGLAVVAAAAAGVAVSLVLSRRTPLWLDEAQTVSIARLAPGRLLDALRHDGSPPLYYLLLHAWMAVVGTGDLAARSLSAVFAVGAVGLTALAAARLAGRRTALAAGALLATAPFLHRYGTEVRMYSLVLLLTAGGLVALQAASRRPGAGPLAAVAAVTALLLLTHYWAFFLVAVTAALVALAARRRPAGDPSRLAAARIVAAMALGGVAFLPWAPSFLYQLAHTGAPWGAPAGAWIFEASLHSLVGERGGLGLLGFTYPALALLGLCAQPLPGGTLELDPAGRPPARPLALVVAATLAGAAVASQLTGSAFATRYVAVVVVPFVVLAARGLAVIENRRLLAVLAVAVLGSGLVRSFETAGAPRTQARQLATALAGRARPGDSVVVCPDQLGPGLARLLPPLGVTTTVYPPGSRLDRVDWVDYTDRIEATAPRAFARSLDRRAAGATVWMVVAPGYHGLDGSCERVFQGLRDLRPASRRVVAEDHGAFEHASLWRFPPTVQP